METPIIYTPLLKKMWISLDENQAVTPIICPYEFSPIQIRWHKKSDLVTTAYQLDVRWKYQYFVNQNTNDIVTDIQVVNMMKTYNAASEFLYLDLEPTPNTFLKNMKFDLQGFAVGAVGLPIRTDYYYHILAVVNMSKPVVL